MASLLTSGGKPGKYVKSCQFSLEYVNKRYYSTYATNFLKPHVYKNILWVCVSHGLVKSANWISPGGGVNRCQYVPIEFDKLTKRQQDTFSRLL